MAENLELQNAIPEAIIKKKKIEIEIEIKNKCLTVIVLIYSAIDREKHRNQVDLYIAEMLHNINGST